jgi:transposase
MVPVMTGNRTNLTIPPELESEMTPAVRAFVLSLFDVIRTQQQRIDELETKVTKLEARLDKTPKNSSLPPSSQHPHAKPKPKRKPSGRKKGGQKGHPKHERALVPPEEVDETITLRPKSCRRCGKALFGDDPQPRRHQVFELPEIKPVVTEYQQHRLECSCCRVSTTAVLPDGVPPMALTLVFPVVDFRFCCLVWRLLVS